MEISCSNQVKTKACRLPKIRHSVTEKEPWGQGGRGIDYKNSNQFK